MSSRGWCVYVVPLFGSRFMNVDPVFIGIALFIGIF